VSDEVVIRTARPADLPDLQRVYRESSLSNVDDRENLLTHPEYLIFAGSGITSGRTTVALVDGRVVGFASVVESDVKQLELEDLFVDPGWQRRGIARRLVADLVQTAHRNGFRTIVVTGNAHAKAFYLAVGFVEFGEEATQFGPAPRFRLDTTSSAADLLTEPSGPAEAV